MVLTGIPDEILEGLENFMLSVNLTNGPFTGFENISLPPIELTISDDDGNKIAINVVQWSLGYADTIKNIHLAVTKCILRINLAGNSVAGL